MSNNVPSGKVNNTTKTGPKTQNLRDAMRQQSLDEY